MADIAITKFNPIYDPYPYKQFSGPVAAQLALATPLQFDAAGRLAAADADTIEYHEFAGLLTKATLAHYTGNAFRGLAYVDGISGLAYGAMLWVSATVAKLTDVNPARNEVQTITITGAPTGGNFTLTFRGVATGNIAFNADAATVQAALEGLASIGSGNVKCAGGALPATPVTVQFTGTLGHQNVELLVGNFAGLTGGTNPDGSVTETTNGRSGLAVARVVPLWDAATPTKIIEIL